MRARVHAIVVVFRAQPGAVVESLSGAVPQLSGLVIVDNSDVTDGDRWEAAMSLACPVRTILNGRNLGVARAFNQGMQAALDAGADLVLLLDEDSRPGPAMVERLVTVWRELGDRGERVAAVGPDFHDRHSGEQALFVQIEGWRLRRVRCAAGTGLIRSEYLMSSGSLIPRSALAGIGTLEESLFIDYVDTEWCLRARSLGYQCYGVCGASMEHGFGERRLSIRWLRGRSMPYRSPVRQYFVFRNALLMVRRPYVPVRWKLNELKRLVLLMLAYLVCAPSPMHQFRCMLRGVAHGIAGRAGPAPGDLDR